MGKVGNIDRSVVFLLKNLSNILHHGTQIEIELEYPLTTGIFLVLTKRYSFACSRTHKVTKPMIWAGIFLAIVGGVILYRHESFSGIPLIHFVIALTLIANGYFLSFKVSPFMLQREKEGRSGEQVPALWQKKITLSLIISDIGWWGGLILFVAYIVGK